MSRRRRAGQLLLRAHRPARGGRGPARRRLRPSSGGGRATGGRRPAAGLRARGRRAAGRALRRRRLGRPGVPGLTRRRSAAQPSGRRSSRCSRPPDVLSVGIASQRSAVTGGGGWCAAPMMSTAIAPAADTSSVKNVSWISPGSRAKNSWANGRLRHSTNRPAIAAISADLPRHERPGHGDQHAQADDEQRDRRRRAVLAPASSRRRSAATQ